MRLRVKIKPITVMIDRDTGATYARMRLQMGMLWQDKRLLDRAANPALDVWARYLSLSTHQATNSEARAAVQARMARFLLPEVSVSDEHSKTASEEWMVAINPDPKRNDVEQAYRKNIQAFDDVQQASEVFANTSWISYDATRQIEVDQAFDYFFFPFDRLEPPPLLDTTQPALSLSDR